MQERENQHYKHNSPSRIKKIDYTYESCTFRDIIVSDSTFRNIRFINCIFDHVIMESCFIEETTILNSKILSLSIRGNRKISKRKLFSKNRLGYLKNVDLGSGNEIKELVFEGDLQIENCEFPEGDNYATIDNPHAVYSKALEIISLTWIGENKRLGMDMINQFYLGKEVKNQNIDFITYSENEYLEPNIEKIVHEVFLLVKHLAG